MGKDVIDSFREYREKMNQNLLDKCFGHSITTEEIMEIFAVANLVEGTIVIPHTRRALEYWEALIKTGSWS